MEFIRRAIIKKGYKDGLEGLIEAVVQAINKMLIYIQVWELTQKPSLEEKYHTIDQQIKKLWEQQKQS